jgi:hypothetical protein
MRRLAAVIVILILVSMCCPAAATAQTRRPSYLILRAPVRKFRGHAYYPGRGYEVRTEAYAYGWFGAKPRRHLRRSTGYNESYIQWTKQ